MVWGGDGKEKGEGGGGRIPGADPQAVAWMTAEQNSPRQHEIFLKKPLALVHSGPKQELRAAAMTGKPTMSPESESEAGTGILAGGAQPRIGGNGAGVGAARTPGGRGGKKQGGESTGPGGEGSGPEPPRRTQP